MTETVIYSTLFLTLLMMVGLFFFIRASTKDRTEILILDPPAAATTTLDALTVYFEQRAYQVQDKDSEAAQITLTGQVRPSWFLAIFLSSLATVGGLCFALVLSSLFPGVGLAFGGLILLAPGAGWFYWRRAGREEQVTLEARSQPETTPQDQIVVTAHRDELIALEQTWKSQLRDLIVTAAAEIAS
ncbi:MAG: cofactor assembly of complex C subunit B [Spirulina sp.]